MRELPKRIFVAGTGTGVGKTVVAAIEVAAANEQSGVAALVAATDAAIQKPLDVLLTVCKVSKAEFMKGNARTNDARKEVGALFEHVGKIAGWQESAIRNYQTSFWIAFRDGIAFDRNLFKGGKSGSAGKRQGESAARGGLHGRSVAD